MGKRAKEHRKKVAKRNARIKADNRRMEKLYNEAMTKVMEQYKVQLQTESGTTEINAEVVEVIEPNQENQ